MGLKDMLSAGIDAIKNGANSVKDAAIEKKQAMEAFDLLKSESEHIGPMMAYEVHNQDPQEGIEELILIECASVNEGNAKLVNQLIPLGEYIINVRVSQEAKTLMDYIFVVTNLKLWIMSPKEYMTVPFENVKTCEIVNKSVMSQGVNFNGNAFVINGSEGEVNTFIDSIMKKDVRDRLVLEKTRYLCGVVPRKQILNKRMKGVTITDGVNVVLHNTPDNRLISLDDVEYMQLLMNDSVVLVKGKPGVDAGSMVSSPMEARKMSVKVVMKTGEYVIETLPQSTMNKAYKREDQVYIKNYEFARKIIDELTKLVEDSRLTAYKRVKVSEKTEVFKLDL